MISPGQGTGDGGGDLIRSRSARLLVDFTTTAVLPTYTTLFTLPITTVLPSSYLAIDFTCSVLMSGPFDANNGPTVRFLIDAVVITPGGGQTVNMVRGLIMPLPYTHREVVTAGVHTVVVEIAYLGPVGQTLTIAPLGLSDLMHAHLRIQEQRS